MNDFISINSNGGYIGRWFWSNTGTLATGPGNPNFWGGTHSVEDIPGLGAWAGLVGIIRYLTLRSVQ